MEKQLLKVKEKLEALTGETSLPKAENWLWEREPSISFVHGRGKHKSEEQRQWEAVFDLVSQWKSISTLWKSWVEAETAIPRRMKAQPLCG